MDIEKYVEKLTPKDNHYLTTFRYEDEVERYLELRFETSPPYSENMASIIAGGPPGTNREDDRHRSAKSVNSNYTINPNQPFVPASRGDLRRREEELRRQGYSITRVEDFVDNIKEEQHRRDIRSLVNKEKLMKCINRRIG